VTSIIVAGATVIWTSALRLAPALAVTVTRVSPSMLAGGV
jgi:hypothetical protein